MKKYKKLNQTNFRSNLLYRDIAISFIIGAIFCFSILKNSNKEISELNNKINENETQIQTLENILKQLKKDNIILTNELKNNKDDISQLIKKLASLCKDIYTLKENLKENLHVNNILIEENIKKLPPNKKEFIASLEDIIKNGNPFANFLDNNLNIVNIKNYVNGLELIKFQNVTVKSIEVLREDFTKISSLFFEKKAKESFWQKQLRFFKEKLLSAIFIESDSKFNPLLDDKTLFEKASKLFSEAKLKESLEELTKIKRNIPEINELINDLKNRINLNSIFLQFKKEFLDSESKNFLN